MALREVRDDSEHVHSIELPDGAVVDASLLIVGYHVEPDADDPEDNGLRFAVHAQGDEPATYYLGLTVRAQQNIAGWGYRIVSAGPDGKR